MIKYFWEIIYSPKKTTEEILKNDFSWWRISWYAVFLAAFTTGMIIMKEVLLFDAGEFLALFVLFPVFFVTTLAYFINFLIFHGAGSIVGGKGRLKKCASVLIHLMIISTILGSIVNFIQGFLIRTSLEDLYKTAMESAMLGEKTHPDLITFIGTMVVLAVVCLYSRFMYEQEYKLKGKKLWLAMSLPLLLQLLLQGVPLLD